MIAVVGATGLVGRKVFEGLIDEGFFNLVLFASQKSNGKVLEYKGKKYTVYTLNESNLELARPKFAIFAAGGKISKEWAKKFTKLGCTVIDNSSYFRHKKTVPLVAYGINNDDIKWHKGIIANPNCSTLGMLPVLKLLTPYKIKRVIITTMQSVSGAGQKGLKHLQNGEKYFDYEIKDNIIPKIGEYAKNGYCEEETKLIKESRKILHLSGLKITSTVTRVPVSFCHSESLNIELTKPLTNSHFIEMLKRDNLIVYEDLPMPLFTTGDTKVHVGRVRKDNSRDNAFNVFVVSDNLLRGAATNAIEILKEIYED